MDEALLDELGRVFARAAVESLLLELQRKDQMKTPPERQSEGVHHLDNNEHINEQRNALTSTFPGAT